MNKKNIILNIILIVLVALTIIQSSFLWIDLPKRETSNQATESYNPEELFIEILKPQKLIVNFGEQRHTILNKFDDTYKEYLDTIFTIFNETEEDSLVPITVEEYLDFQQKRSIVFEFNRVITGNIFRNLLGFSNKSNKKNDNIPISNIYISDSDVIIGNANGYFKSNISINKSIATTLSTIENQGYENYNNFFELYGIKKNLLFPQKTSISVRDVYYSSDLLQVEQQTKNNLAEKLLSQSIDYIQEITQDNGTTFVYEDKFLTLNNNGAIYYEDSSNIESKDRNLYTSLNSSINFIANKVGTVESLSLSKIEPIELGKNLGYKFSFNISEDSVPVVINGEKYKNYIELQVFSDHIRSYQQAYRQIENDPEIKYTNTRVLPLESIVDKNRILFVDELSELTVQDILAKIQDIDLVYLYDFPKEEFQKLSIAVKINYDNRELFFSTESGKFIMER
ncbi:hypothetical protein SAMN02745245_01241 [Anaerosphaera aminiphila DSM 21120]|uniref:Two-component signal transduction system YycFG, regulatory protein YycH n=1 Tax=Anaerosphaera aminiphila DSM 21120 TaxID=1120995 RepID=A0A1M5SPP6_9FIRM|nr:hypothetical protein [Anaerosphaera aminiphila]SHH40476.1 hypothetical protein SAMN02745245_01241 [Anaerosphaera aminiphila DSM 21120]